MLTGESTVLCHPWMITLVGNEGLKLELLTLVVVKFCPVVGFFGVYSTNETSLVALKSSLIWRTCKRSLSASDKTEIQSVINFEDVLAGLAVEVGAWVEFCANAGAAAIRHTKSFKSFIFFLTDRPVRRRSAFILCEIENKCTRFVYLFNCKEVLFGS